MHVIMYARHIHNCWRECACAGAHIHSITENMHVCTHYTFVDAQCILDATSLCFHTCVPMYVCMYKRICIHTCVPICACGTHSLMHKRCLMQPRNIYNMHSYMCTHVCMCMTCTGIYYSHLFWICLRRLWCLELMRLLCRICVC
jgi:hypothetical protein